MQAIKDRRSEMVQIMLQHGCDCNLGTYCLPLALAAYIGYEEIVQLLIQTPGCKLNITGQDNKTALDAAVERGYRRIVRMLVLSGANIGTRYPPHMVHIINMALLYRERIHLRVQVIGAVRQRNHPMHQLPEHIFRIIILFI